MTRYYNVGYLHHHPGEASCLVVTMMNLLGVWLLLSSLTQVVVGGSIDGEGYMYGTRTASIQEYSETTGQFQKSTRPRVVEFYNPSCVSHTMLG